MQAKRANRESVISAFKDIRNVAESAGIPVLLVIFPYVRNHDWEAYPYQEFHQKVAEAGRSSGFHVIDLLNVFSYFRANRLMVRQGDSHPGTLGHSIAAAEILQYIAHNNLLVCPGKGDGGNKN